MLRQKIYGAQTLIRKYCLLLNRKVLFRMIHFLVSILIVVIRIEYKTCIVFDRSFGLYFVFKTNLRTIFFQYRRNTTALLKGTLSILEKINLGCCTKSCYSTSSFVWRAIRMSKSPYWRDENQWVCPKHLPSVKIPAHIEQCWFAGCVSRRPSMDSRPSAIPVTTNFLDLDLTNLPVEQAAKPEILQDIKLCAWMECTKGPNGGRAPARKNSKYCSRDCSNRFARWRHKNRKKNQS